MLKLTIVTLFLQATTALTSNSPEDLDLSNIIIEFYPYSSILDLYDRRRYTTEDLVPFVSKVATKFKNIALDLHVSSFARAQKTSYFLSGYAIAKYNCLNTTTRKMNLYLEIYGNKNCDCKITQEILQTAAKFANEINKLCSETVSTILLRSTSKCPLIMSECGNRLNLTNGYKWGEFIPISDYCNPKTVQNITRRPDVLVLTYSNPYDLFTIDVTLCQPYPENGNEELILMKKVGLSDTKKDNSIQMKTFISFWQQATNQRNYKFLFQGAFDAYSWTDENKISMFKNGWWYLQEDPGNTNTNEFLFQEKYIQAVRIDDEENVKNLPWYSNKTFNKNTSGILFHDYLAELATCTDFQRVLTLKLSDVTRFRKKFEQKLALCSERFQLFILMSELTSKDIHQLLILKNVQITLLIPLSTNNLPQGYDISYQGIIKESGFKYGYFIHMENCGLYNDYDTISKSMINNALADVHSTINIFHYEEYEDTVSLGATRMFRLRNTLFERCRKLVLKSRKTEIETGYALRGFYKGRDFYESEWQMKNYVKYIELLSDWAENCNQTVVFLGSDEDVRFNGDFGRTWETVGWYSYNAFVEKKGYKPKSVSRSLNVSTFPNKHVPYFGLTQNQFITVLCLILVFFLSIILIVTYFVHHFRTKFPLTYEECKAFFEGRSENELTGTNPSDAQYDRVTYEVSDCDFTINTDELLGSGEFGVVCRGTVTICDVEIQVAVKTTNPQKLHKTMLNGLLSEIKVLSYVGRHPNIIRLFGANTSSLKTGKVFVFLELCELGCLRNFLQKLRTVECGHITNYSPYEPNNDNQCVNLSKTLKLVMDASLSNEFYRWSQEICNGMEYLARKHVVHADLSTRNILLNLRREAKICDFGLSRRMYNYENYVKSQQEPMPWKWMAPESLRDMVYNEKTDIWAYGITLWEIYSLGSLPYPGLTWNDNFVQMLEDGLVPSSPDFEEKNMYDLMKNCWKIVPDQRPTFTEILSMLTYSEVL